MGNHTLRRRVGAVVAALAVALTGAVTVAAPAGATLTKGVGDVSSAMRYGTGTVIGDPLTDVKYVDDDHSDQALPWPINFFGTKSNALCITTNGTISPIASVGAGCSDEYDKNVETLASASSASVIAALALDLDASNCPDGDAVKFGGQNWRDTSDGFAQPCVIYYGSTTVNGRDAVVITWYRFPTNDEHNNGLLTNTLQVVLIKRPTVNGDTVGYDFDIEINIGTAKDNDDGYKSTDVNAECDGSTPETIALCRWGMGWAKWDSGTSTATGWELFANSPINDLVDSGGAKSLVKNKLNTTVLGRYTWGMVGGETVGFSAPTMGGDSEPLSLKLNLALGSSLAGASSTLTGSGLQADSLFTLTMYSKAVRLYRGRTDANGNFTRKIKLPSKVCVGSGKHRLKLVGTKPDGSSTSATTYLMIGSGCKVLAIVGGGKNKTVQIGGILFARHSALLSGIAKARLRTVAPLLKSAKEITLTGYTETKLRHSTVAQNKALAKRRAIAVRNYLRAYGVTAPDFTLVAVGPYNPTGKGQAANRRVIIKVRYLVKLAG